PNARGQEARACRQYQLQRPQVVRGRILDSFHDDPREHGGRDGRAGNERGQPGPRAHEGAAKERDGAHDDQAPAPDVPGEPDLRIGNGPVGKPGGQETRRECGYQDADLPRHRASCVRPGAAKEVMWTLPSSSIEAALKPSLSYNRKAGLSAKTRNPTRRKPRRTVSARVQSIAQLPMP